MDDLDISHLDSSSQIMIAEHQRLAQLFLYNAEMGERRTSLYLSVVSLGGAGLIGLAQFMDASLLFWPTYAFLVGMLILGVLTFQRLIERRIRAVEDLRALNRIHRYFADKDPQIADYFYWPPCDDLPSFHGRGGLFAGLRDVIAFINSLFAGFLAGETVATLWPGPNLLLPLCLGIIIGLVFWTLHQVYERKTLDRTERAAAAKDVRFPNEKFTYNQAAALGDDSEKPLSDPPCE